MKKLLFLIGLFVSLTCCAFGLSACNKDEHAHTWGEWEISTPSTCTEEGEEKRTCSECGAQETRPADKIPHSYNDDEWQTVKPASCTEEGEETNICTVCHQSVTRPVEKLDHTYSKGWITEIQATCTQKGLEKNVCDVCHQEDSREIDEIPHSYGNWYTLEEATCAKEGLQRRDCIVCNPEGADDKAYETESIQRLPHTEIHIEKLEANCLEEGHEAGVRCEVCQEVIEGLEVIPALGHSLGEPVKESESTCTTHGIEKQTCTREGCEHSVEKQLPLKEHNRVPIGEKIDATCEGEGITAGEKCSECEKIFERQKTIPPLGHKMQDPEPIETEDGKYWHRESCSRCSHYVDTECTFTVEKTPATCTTAERHVHTCYKCAFKYEHDEGNALGHNFGEWHFDVEAYDASLNDEDGAATVVRQHRRVCSNPGHTEDPENPEVEACSKATVGDPVLPTCTTIGYTNYKCETCESEYTDDRVDALGHQWKKNDDGSEFFHELYHGINVHYKECEREGCVKPKDTYYSCRYTTAIWESATCEKGLTLVKVCEDCKYKVEEVHGSPLGHNYTPWEHLAGTSGESSKHTHRCQRCQDEQTAPCEMQSSNIVPTCQKPGREIDICKDCKYTEEGEELEMLEHDVEGQPYSIDRANKRHYQQCKRCWNKVYENCLYETVTTDKTCTADAKTRYTCKTCHDDYTEITEKSIGHEVAEYSSCDKYSHSGQCKYCKEQVSVKHDFSESNICSVCKTDGLSYAFLSGSGNTKAIVTRSIKDGAAYRIQTPKIVIPEMVDIDGNGEVPVVSIGTSAFALNSYIEEVVLPLSLESIGYDAFLKCEKLAKVSINGHNVGDSGIKDCKLNRIENNAFSGCKSLTNAILPETLQYIGAGAFKDCVKLAEITIPASVTEIQDFAFRNTAYYNNRDKWIDGVLYIGPHLIEAHKSLKGSYEVLQDAVSISAEAFKDCTELTQITLPAALKAIDKDAFAGCTSLNTVIFKGTFEQYLEIRFDNDAASPMHFATTLTIEGAKGTPVIPETATSVPAGAFRGSDIESIVIPASVTSIGANAFRDCARLTSVKFAEGSNISFIGADVVLNTPFYENEENWEDGVLYLKDEKNKEIALVSVDQSKVNTEYTAYDGEEVEGSFKHVAVKEGTRVIAPLVFENFTDLRMLTVASTVIYLGPEMVKGCANLTRVNFRGQGQSWFAFSTSIGRVYTDEELFGGEDNNNIDAQKRAAEMFKLYNAQWKRGNYVSG